MGLAQGAMEQAIKQVKSRVQFGKPLASFQVVQFHIAEMATKIELARNIIYKACSKLDQGIIGSKLVAMVKWYGARIGVEVADEAVSIAWWLWIPPGL